MYWVGMENKIIGMEGHFVKLLTCYLQHLEGSSVIVVWKLKLWILFISFNCSLLTLKHSDCCITFFAIYVVYTQQLESEHGAMHISLNFGVARSTDNWMEYVFGPHLCYSKYSKACNVGKLCGTCPTVTSEHLNKYSKWYYYLHIWILCPFSLHLTTAPKARLLPKTALLLFKTDRTLHSTNPPTALLLATNSKIGQLSTSSLPIHQTTRKHYQLLLLYHPEVCTKCLIPNYW